MKLIRALNNYFICDKDEQVNVTEAIFLFGVFGFVAIVGIVFTVLSITN